MTLEEFQQSIREGIPVELPVPQPYDPQINHAPKRKDILTREEKQLAVRNALRYFDPRHHAVLAPIVSGLLMKCMPAISGSIRTRVCRQRLLWG